MPIFSKTGSRNMAEICAINFLTLFSYSTSIVIWALQRLLLPFLIRAGPDWKISSKTNKVRFSSFCPIFDRPLQKKWKSQKNDFWQFGSRPGAVSILKKTLLCSIYFADRWRCKCAIRTPARKHVQGAKFGHPSLRHKTSYRSEIYKFATAIKAVQLCLV